MTNDPPPSQELTITAAGSLSKTVRSSLVCEALREEMNSKNRFSAAATFYNRKQCHVTNTAFYQRH